MTATFTLWRPIVAPGGDICVFDVKRSAFEQLKDGTPELVARFLADLEMGGRAASWKIQSFCSPYYAAADASGSWLDRYPMAWRVAVAFESPIKLPEKPPYLGPHPSEAIDETWEEAPESWEWSTRDGVVIADFFDHQLEASRTQLEASPSVRACRRIEFSPLIEKVIEGRFEMGPIELPRDEDRINELVRDCQKRAFSVNWAETLRLLG
jgi:hypothetical protein